MKEKREEFINEMSVVKLGWSEAYGMYDSWSLNALIYGHIETLDNLIRYVDQGRLQVEEAEETYNDLKESFSKLLRKVSIRVSEEL